MNTIHLHGALKKFGGPFTLDVRTPAEAVHALCQMRPGLEQAIRKGVFRVIRGPRKGGMDLDHTELGMNLGGQMHLVPAARGRKNGGSTKAIIGTVLMVTAAFLIFGPGGGLGALKLIVGTQASAMLLGAAFSMGLSLTLTGISMMMAPTPVSIQGNTNYLFNGIENTSDQGAPVPLVFGQIRVGSVLISSSLEADEATPTSMSW